MKTPRILTLSSGYVFLEFQSTHSNTEPEPAIPWYAGSTLYSQGANVYVIEVNGMLNFLMAIPFVYFLSHEMHS